MADDQKPSTTEIAPAVMADKPKPAPRVLASDELKNLAGSQKPKGMIGRLRADGRLGPLPMPARKDISAFTRADVIDRWSKDAAGVRAVEVGDNVITMFGVIGEDFWSGDGITAKGVTAQLRAIGADRPVEVHMNSFGGDMFEGIAIYNVLREHPQPVTVKVMGIAASAASIITMAADTVEIGSGSFIMIHNCSCMAGGNRHDFAEMAAFLAPFDSAMADVYAERTGMDAAAIAKLMDSETYMSGAAAVSKGFADKIMTADKTKTDTTAQASDRNVNELRAMEHQLIASGVSRKDARDRIAKVQGKRDAAPGDDPMRDAGTEDDNEIRSAAIDLLASLRA